MCPQSFLSIQQTTQKIPLPTGFEIASHAGLSSIIVYLLLCNRAYTLFFAILRWNAFILYLFSSLLLMCILSHDSRSISSSLFQLYYFEFSSMLLSWHICVGWENWLDKEQRVNHHRIITLQSEGERIRNPGLMRQRRSRWKVVDHFIIFIMEAMENEHGHVKPSSFVRTIPMLMCNLP